MSVREVSDGIARISLAWGNTYVLRDPMGGREAALIDCGLQKDRPALLAGLLTLHIEPADVRTVLLTHAHCDHAGNAAYFAKLGANIVLHEQEAPYLQLPRRSYTYTGVHALRRPFTSLAFTIGEVTQPVERCEVGQTVADGELINAPGGSLRVIHTPGHAPGHIAFYREQDQLLFSGDAILNIIPIKRVTALSLPMRLFSDDWAQAKRSAIRLIQLRPRLLYAGHGLPLTGNVADSLTQWGETLEGGRRKEEGGNRC